MMLAYTQNSRSKGLNVLVKDSGGDDLVILLICLVLPFAMCFIEG